MSEDKEFDGIRSADNKMPGWYIVSFIGTVIFGIGYLLYYHVFTDWSQAKQYAAEMAVYKTKYKTEEVRTSGGNPYRGQADAIAAGKSTFAANCAACHGPEAKGNIGPNLTDATWLHGDTEDEIFHTISEGVGMDQVKQSPPKGPMPSWKATLDAKTRWQVIAFLESLNSSIKPSDK